MLIKVINKKDKYKDDNTYDNIVEYCINREKCIHNYISVRNLDRNNIAKDMNELAAKFGKNKGTRIRHIVVSFSKKDHASIDIVNTIAEWACDYYEDNYQIFSAVHENKPSLHFHLVFNTVNINNGKKFKGKKKDYYDFLYFMRLAAREYRMKLYVE